MAAPNNIQLGSLEFDEIKASLISYLQEQDTLKDYDYSGSAMQTLLEVLAYNTMYYGHYSNMVANEMFLDTAQREESLMSLVKPLGYVVPGKSSARGVVFIRGARNADGSYSNSLPRYTRFVGRNNQGVSYNFYNLEPVSLIEDLADAGEAIFTVVEGKTLIKENPIIIDNITQKSFIQGTDIDISTIRVEVLNNDTSEWEEWERKSNTSTGLDENSKVYWLERSELGFFVVFGGNLGAITSDQIGRVVTQNDQVRISYLKSSGSDGNEVGAFTIQDWTADSNQTLSLSENGSDSPNLDAIRFFAPKWFAAQDRAVTVNDARAVLSEQGFGMDVSDPYISFNVWGGEEMNPPMYGRMFVSVNTLGSNNTETAQIRNQALTTLKDKTCIGILPEFIAPLYIDLNISGFAPYSVGSTDLNEAQLSAEIQNLFMKEYDTRRYETSVKTGRIANMINGLLGGDVFNVSAGDLTLTAVMTINAGNTPYLRTHYFRNEMEDNTLITGKGNVVYGTYIENYLEQRGYSADDVDIFLEGSDGIIFAKYTEENTDTFIGQVGSYDVDKGTVTIRDDVYRGPFRLAWNTKNTFSGQQEILCSVNTGNIVPSSTSG
tara:strand:- start:614 stop:2428 length:1815 start_codon:yes stop_codon:yes gene_type:complete